MPQMAPLSWLTLFFYFTLVFLIINPLNYFLFTKTETLMTTKTPHQIKDWKW